MNVTQKEKTSSEKVGEERRNQKQRQQRRKLASPHLKNGILRVRRLRANQVY
ncbi:hypothetical protein I314_06428 [Cryptococcus bacillisporus CA1873]|uniref:Uncharacterized protein n=1 Tax=Cryptococcus bacillisporus CA1873 TaxID=1296111 RepID=A0ABR5B293_CRYGA|nr:hypothetical protein I314_06428 [Cryptococcus bacillisporus CA1873]|eukprot:KIR57711.1 hypothetical protein I314_06428 [Cryptococcus gattii CA1873]